MKGGKGALPPVAATIRESGFVLQDFPQTGGQAAALEKCLTGFDLEAQKAKQSKASKIAPPPELVSVLDNMTSEGAESQIFFCV